MTTTDKKVSSLVKSMANVVIENVNNVCNVVLDDEEGRELLQLSKTFESKNISRPINDVMAKYHSGEKVTIDDINSDIEWIMGMFLCNDINGPLAELEPRLQVHFFYSVIKSVFISINGIVTFDEASLKAALESIQESLKIVQVNRRKKPSYLGSFFSAIDYNSYSEDECFAELCHLILTSYHSMMILATEKTILGLMKVGYYSKSCLSTLKECDTIIEQRLNWTSSRTKMNFEYAIFMAHAVFGLAMSMSPPRVLRLLSFFGYSFDRNRSLEVMEMVATSESIWSSIAGLSLLGYHLQIEFIAGLGQCNLELTAKILAINKSRYPQSGFFMMFEGIHEQIKGDLPKAIKLIYQTRQCFDHWVEWQNACDWLLVWCHSIQRQWPEAEKCIIKLVDKCTWSPCVFTYIHAAVKQMMIDDGNFKDPDQLEKLRKEIDDLLILAPKLKNSVAGKTIYFEKFVTKRCDIYKREKCQDENVTLLLPMLEQMFFWNIFSMSTNSPNLLMSFVDLIDSRLPDYKMEVTDSENNNSTSEKYLYLILMKGICCHYIKGKESDAKKYLQFVVDNQSNLNLYQHLAPLACLELGVMYSKSENEDDQLLAIKYLTSATHDYRQYLNETMVHMRATSAMNQIKARQKMNKDRKVSKTELLKRSQSEATTKREQSQLKSNSSESSFDSARSAL